MNNMQHLKYAVEVERVGSITLAAENLYMSQPSLSKAILELESNLGFSVFERTSRGILPTRKGQIFLDHAHAILRQMAEIEALSAGDEAGHQALSLSVPQAAYVAEAVTRFAASLDPQKPTRIRVEETDSNTTMEGVASGAFRLGILRHPSAEDVRVLEQLKKKKLKSETVWEYEPVLLLGRNSPLAFRQTITRTDLEGALEISGNSADADARLYVEGRALKLELVGRLPGTYLWSAPVTVSTLERYDLVQKVGTGLKERMCERLIYAADTRLSASERTFIDRLFEVKNELTFGEKPAQ